MCSIGSEVGRFKEFVLSDELLTFPVVADVDYDQLRMSAFACEAMSCRSTNVATWGVKFESYMFTESPFACAMNPPLTRSFALVVTLCTDCMMLRHLKNPFEATTRQRDEADLPTQDNENSDDIIVV